MGNEAIVVSLPSVQNVRFLGSFTRRTSGKNFLGTNSSSLGMVLVFSSQFASGGLVPSTRVAFPRLDASDFKCCCVHIRHTPSNAASKGLGIPRHLPSVVPNGQLLSFLDLRLKSDVVLCFDQRKKYMLAIVMDLFYLTHP
jgi:hypothetical protein